MDRAGVKPRQRIVVGEDLESTDGERPEADTHALDISERAARILAAFHGTQTTITDAGRENMRTVNRLTRIMALRHVGSDKTFRHNLSRYRSDALDRDIVIGARREGNGVWTLVAELTPRGTSSDADR